MSSLVTEIEQVNSINKLINLLVHCYTKKAINEELFNTIFYLLCEEMKLIKNSIKNGFETHTKKEIINLIFKDH
jgi:hypothetical protein